VQRVLIVENKLLLGAGIETLLANEPEVDVIGITPVDENSLIQEIYHIQPDVVVLDAETTLIDPNNKQLSQLQENLQFRTITVSANDNLIRVYDKQEIMIVQTTNLIKIIKNNYDLSS